MFPARSADNRIVIIPCPDEDHLEEYALGRGDQAERTTIEEHWLVCDRCRTRLDQILKFIVAVRTHLHAAIRGYVVAVELEELTSA